MTEQSQRAVDPLTGEPIHARETDLPPSDMPEYPPPRTKVVRERVPVAERVRGGVSPLAILTGMLVAFGLMLVLSAIVGVIAANTDVATVSRDEAVRLGIGAAAVFVAAQLLAYWWGGYAAGRMARGAGWLNGVLVPVAALAVGAITALVVEALGETPRFVFPFQRGRFPIAQDTVYTFGAIVGVVSLVAMIVGGLAGGIMGARWHAKLERRATSDRYYGDAYRAAS